MVGVDGIAADPDTVAPNSIRMTMSLLSMDLFHIFVALATLVVIAHVGGFLAAKISLPVMVGELIGGLLLGPTGLSRVFPEISSWLIPITSQSGRGTATSAVVGFCSQLGLLLLMFIGGLQMRRLVSRQDARAVGWITFAGTAIPVLVGISILLFTDMSGYVGPARSLLALHIVLIAALAVTSIPVITRIFLDLGLLESRLARIVLSVAVIEDVLLYVAISFALGTAGAQTQTDASILAWLNLKPDSITFILWHIVASLGLLLTAAWGFQSPNNNIHRSQLNLIARRSPAGWTIIMILAITLAAMLLGLAPIYGALVAGIASSNNLRPELVAARMHIESIASGFFIPIYFATIGFTLDLFNQFDTIFTLSLLAVGTAAKYSGSLLGARIAGESRPMATALAISINARGGPGIVLATTSFAAGIVTGPAFTALIILAIATSVAAGSWLAWILRNKPEYAVQLRSRENLSSVIKPISAS